MRPAVELVGPAGSGKTTLYRALAERCPGITSGLERRRLDHLRHGLLPLARLAPAWLRAGGRFLDDAELRSFGYVTSWAAALERGAPDDALTVFDHGPLFRIARLRATGPPLVGSRAFARWCAAAVRRWAGLLDAVVWLDAPDALLARRIEEREQRHRMKGGAAEETERFLLRYRSVYETLLAELRAAGGPEPIRVDTSRESPDALAARLLPALRPAHRDTGRHARPAPATP